MALQKLKVSITDFIVDNPDAEKQDLLNHIFQYIDADYKTYQSNKANDLLTFGKYKSHSVAQILELPKGRDYLKWLLSQTWMTEDKFEYIFRACRENNVDC